MSAQNKGEIILTFFYFRYIYIIKNSNMKSKLFLEEGEIARILNMHKKAIQEQTNVNGDEVENNQVEMDEELDEGDLGNITSNMAIGAVTGSFIPVVGTVAGAVIGASLGYLMSSSGSYEGVKKIFQACKVKGSVGKSTMSQREMGQIAGDLYNAINGVGTNEDLIKSALSRILTIPDLCEVNKRYADNHPGSNLFSDIDGDIDSDSEWNEFVYNPLLSAVRKTKELSKNNKTQQKNNNVTTKSKCPKIEKTYLDQGFVMVTEKRYKELANNKTRERKYVWCPISKTNLYFAKVIEGIKDDQHFEGPGTGTGGGGSLPFDYNAVLTAINAKCAKDDGSGGKDNGIDIDIDKEKIVPTPKMPTDVYDSLGK